MKELITLGIFAAVVLGVWRWQRHVAVMEAPDLVERYRAVWKAYAAVKE